MLNNYKQRLIDIGVVVLVICSLPLVWSVLPRHRTVIVNCSISEISPDFTTEMREACRKIKTQK